MDSLPLPPRSPWRRIKTVMDAGEVAGVYVLIQNGRAIYVGQSLRLVERLRGHKWRISPEGVKTRWGFLPGAYVKVRPSRRFGEWLMAEARLIRRLAPIHNARMFERALQPKALPIAPDGSLVFNIQWPSPSLATPTGADYA